MVVLSKIYTRTGDDGTTALGSGRRVAKYDLRVECYGTLDETNAAIGLARAAHRDRRPSARCHARAHPERSVRSRRRALLPGREQGRARAIVGDAMRKSSGSKARSTRSTASFSRCAPSCFRAARQRRAFCTLRAPSRAAPSGSWWRLRRGRTSRSADAALRYINRLSDFLFVAARYANDKGKSDVLWVPGQNR